MRNQRKKLGKSMMSVFLTLSSLGTQKTCQRKAAAGPSGIVAEMLKQVGEAGAEEVRDLVENIISEGCIPTDWQESFIVNLYKGKGEVLNRGNYRGLKLIEQVTSKFREFMSPAKIFF